MRTGTVVTTDDRNWELIGIAAVDELKRAGDTLHSRKLRSFDEPPFR